MSLTLHQDFTNPSLIAAALKGPVLDITRATEGTMVDADGFIRPVFDGEARFPGATWRANLGTSSNDLSSGIYVKNNCTVAQDAEGRDGTANSAWTITADGAGAGTEFVGPRYDAVTSRTTIGRVILSSWYAKPGTKAWIYAYNSSPGAVNRVWFNVSTGTLGSSEGTVLDYGIAPAGNGFYRCWLTQLDTDDNNRVYVSAADDDLVLGMDNSGAAQDAIILQDFMAEDVSGRTPTPSPSTYIETTTAPVSQLSGSSDGLLIEEARTNICLQSEDFSTTWTETNGASTFNQTIAPDGSNTADQLLDNSATGTGGVRFTQAFTVATTTAYTFSIFAKADQLSWLNLLATNWTTPVNSGAYFNLADGTIGTVDAGFDDSGIEDWGNGWYRCWVSLTSDAADTTGEMRIQLADADNDNTVDLDGTSSIFVWGAQLEAGAFPTSYIPTTTASVTRNLELVTSTSLSGEVGVLDGSFYVRAKQDPATNGANTIFQIDDGSNANRYLWYTPGSSTLRMITAADGGQSTVNVDAPAALTDGVFVESVVGLATDDAVAYQDGVIGDTDVSYEGLNAAPTRIRVGQAGANQWNGVIAELRYYDERLDNNTLLNMSNGEFPAEAYGHAPRVKRANDAALWYHQMRLKQEDEEALKLIREILG
jgi:hypothetical protein